MNKNKIIKITILVCVIALSVVYIATTIYFNYPRTSFPLIDSSKSFSVVVLPDTQFYSANNPEIFCRQTEWIKEMKDRLNIVFVSHMGDIVNDGAEKMYEWENASRCMSKLDGVLPYSVVPGNHDLDVQSNKESGFSTFSKFFPSHKFEEKSWYGGSYQNNRNSFQKITVNGLEILFLNLEIEPSYEVLDWANGVIRANPNLYTIVTTHKYLPVGSSVRDSVVVFGKNGNSGEDIWTKLIYNNCSIRQVWSGHFHGENKIVTKNKCGDDVYQILQDYQDRTNGGDGWLRLFVFDTKDKNINVYTYSPFLRLFEDDSDSRFQFKLD